MCAALSSRDNDEHGKTTMKLIKTFLALLRRRPESNTPTQHPGVIKWLGSRRAREALYVRGQAIVLWFGTDHTAVIFRGIDGLEVSTTQTANARIPETSVDALYGALLYALADCDYCTCCLPRFLGVKGHEAPADEEPVTDYFKELDPQHTYWYLRELAVEASDECLPPAIIAERLLEPIDGHVIQKAMIGMLVTENVASETLADYLDTEEHIALQMVRDQVSSAVFRARVLLETFITDAVHAAQEVDEDEELTLWERTIRFVNEWSKEEPERRPGELAEQHLKLLRYDVDDDGFAHLYIDTLAVMLSDEHEAMSIINAELGREPTAALDLVTDEEARAATHRLAVTLLSRYVELDRIWPKYEDEKLALEARIEEHLYPEGVYLLARALSHELPTAKSTQIADLLSALMTDEQRAVFIADGRNCWDLSDAITSDVDGHREHLEEVAARS